MRYLIEFMRPIQHAHEAMPPRGIVTWFRAPHERKMHRKYFTLDFAENAHEIEYVSKYGYEVFIDLWIIKLRFGWIGRERKAPK